MQALEAGCHVLMEKPMVTSADDAHKLAAKVAQTKKVFTIGYNTPCTPEFAYLRETIRNKSLGKLELISGWLSQNWLKFTIGTWRQKPELSGGGQAYDSGAHLLNSLCWSVESDVAGGVRVIDNVGTPVDINSVINVRFASNVLAQHHGQRQLPRGRRGDDVRVRQRPHRHRRLGRVVDQRLPGQSEGEVSEHTGHGADPQRQLYRRDPGESRAAHEPAQRDHPKRVDGRDLRIGAHR
jgi:hypothetical protein